MAFEQEIHFCCVQCSAFGGVAVVVTLYPGYIFYGHPIHLTLDLRTLFASFRVLQTFDDLSRCQSAFSTCPMNLKLEKYIILIVSSPKKILLKNALNRLDIFFSHVTRSLKVGDLALVQKLKEVRRRSL